MSFLIYSRNNFYSSISYNYGLDYYSYGLVILTLLIISLIIISRCLIKNTFNSLFFMLVILFLCLCLIFVFRTLHILVIYFFFEFRLIPLLILIYIWGYQPERLISGLYLFFYTLLASLPLLLIIINFWLINITLFFDMTFFISCSFIIHIFMYIAFLVKLPMFIVHFWLPKAHVQAPVSGSIILAGLLLKIGGYGFIRFISLNEPIFLFNSYI